MVFAFPNYRQVMARKEERKAVEELILKLKNGLTRW
jgi:Tfp pilus assembly protein FimT